MNTSGNREDFFRLIEENKRIIIKICNSYCALKSDRQDLAQEIIYQLWKSGNRFDPDYKFSTWMYKVALNVAISFFRQNKKDRSVTLEEWHIEVEDPPSAQDEKEQHIRLLQQLISEMKDLDKAMIVLWSESRSYREISEIIGITETNVATRISRLKEKLKLQFAAKQPLP